MKAKQALAWVCKFGIAVESARARVPSLAQAVAGEPLRGGWWAHPKGRDIFSSVSIDSQLSRRSGVPAGGWENYLRSSASLARPHQAGWPVFQRETGGGNRNTHANGQAQAARHSLSRVGAEGGFGSRAAALARKGSDIINGPALTLSLKMPITSACRELGLSESRLILCSSDAN